MRFADRNVMQTGIFYHTAGFVTATNRLPQLFRDGHCGSNIAQQRKEDKQKERSRAFFLFSYAIMPEFRTHNTASYKHPSAAGDVRTPPYLQDTHGYPAQ